MTRYRPRPWDELTAREQAAVERELAKTRPLDECDPARVTRLAVALGLRPGHLPAAEPQEQQAKADARAGGAS